MLAPLLAGVALAVRLGLGSPVLFRHRRPGRNEAPFWLLKFRSMTDACDAQGVPLPDAERLTRFGRWLRSTSLDELPELWNVLRGEMSLVGPRPLMMEYLPLYSAEQRRRHDVLPGITGWAQIHGRNRATWPEKFRYDVAYVRRCSLSLDLRILALTVWKVLRREGINEEGQATASCFAGNGVEPASSEDLRRTAHPPVGQRNPWLRRLERWDAEGVPPIDFQMHTRWTDGASTVSEMIAAASRRGLKAITLTEHVNRESQWYPRFVEEVKAIRACHPELEVYYGAEIAAADEEGGLKTDPSQLDAELVLGVVHRYPRKGGGWWRFEELTAQDAIELELRLLEGLARNPYVDVLGHPGGTAFKKYGPFPVAWMEPAFRAACQHGVAVELNTKYLWDLSGMMTLLRRIDPLVSFGSDAHDAKTVGTNWELLRVQWSKQ